MLSFSVILRGFLWVFFTASEFGRLVQAAVLIGIRSMVVYLKIVLFKFIVHKLVAVFELILLLHYGFSLFLSHLK